MMRKLLLAAAIAAVVYLYGPDVRNWLVLWVLGGVRWMEPREDADVLARMGWVA